MAIFYNPETGQYEWDDNEGPLPNEMAPWDPATGQPLGPPPNSAWNPDEGLWNTIPVDPRQLLQPDVSPPVGPGPTPPPSGPPSGPPPGPPPGSAPGGPGGDEGGDRDGRWGTGPVDLGPLLEPYTGQFRAPARGEAFKNLSSLLGPVPEFSAPALPQQAPFSYESFPEPAPFTFEEYRPTTGTDVFADPSYGFRKDIGERALLNTKAAKGLLNVTATLKDLLEYNQNFAAQEFGNVDARRFRDYGMRRGHALETAQTNLQNRVGAYGINRGNAFENWKANRGAQFDLYDRGLEAERERFAPKLYEWQTRGALGMRAEDKARDDAFKEFQTDYDIWRNQRRDVFDRLKWASDFGLDAATR